MKKIAVINDLSGMGRCSLTASIPVLSVMGHQACPLPTAVLSGQTGYESFFMYDFTEHMDDFVNEWEKADLSFDGIYTGFLSGEKQAKKVVSFIKKFKKQNTLLLVDPVMGDNGKLYASFNKGLCEEIKLLATYADILTPNLTEACILADVDFAQFTTEITEKNFFDKHYDLCEKLLGSAKYAILTGVEKTDGVKYVYNFFCSKQSRNFTKNRMYGGHFSGTGDLLASAVLGSLLRGQKLSDGIELAAEFVEKAVKDSFHHGVAKNDGANFQRYLKLLL